MQRNEIRPHLNSYWCIPPKEDAEFVAHMEDILDVYQLPHDPQFPVWCMDEKPYQLLDDSREPLPMRPGDVAKIDSEYVRHGTVSVFCFMQPHTGRIEQIFCCQNIATDYLLPSHFQLLLFPYAIRQIEIDQGLIRYARF